MRQSVSYIFFMCMFLLLGISSASAQSLSVSPGIELTPSVSDPAPGQNITITARSYNTDINSATIVWIVDGKETKRGVGATILEVTAPTLGKRSTVSTTVITPTGERLSASITLGSGSVDLIVEGDGYTPPLFSGKIGPVYQNKTKIIAVPHLANASGVEYDPKNLVYIWRRNELTLEDQSGFGKRAISVEEGVVPRPYTLSVTVETRDGSLQTSGATIVSPRIATLEFYVNDPLYGPLFNKAIGTQVNLGKQRESSVLAVPYGFNKPKTGIGDLIYSWTINGLSSPDLAENQSIILRAPEDSAGSSEVGLEIQSNEKILQAALKGFTVSFSATVPATSEPGAAF